MRVAIVVGHRKGSQGAVSVTGITEWQFNAPLAGIIAAHASAGGLEADVVFRPNIRRGAMTALVSELNGKDYDAIVSLHFNATASHNGRGHLVLHYPGSVKGETLAKTCSEAMAILEPTIPNKGLWPTKVNGAGTELYILTKTKAPTCLIESHFGDVLTEHNHATEQRYMLGESIGVGLVKWATELVG